MFPTIEDFQRLFIDPLPLPDNRDARQLRWLELSRALEPVLPDYDPSDGKQALLAKYARKLAAQRAEAAETAVEDSLVKTRAERRRQESHDPADGIVAGRAGKIIDTRTDSDVAAMTRATVRP
jgi:hypothetical protein